MERIQRLKSKLQSTIQDDQSDYFRPMDYFLIIGGIHLSSDRLTLRALFVCYRALMTAQFSVWIDRVYVAYSEWHSLSELIGVVSFFMGLVMIIAREILIGAYLEDIKTVRTYLESRLNGPKHSESRIWSYRLLWRIGIVLEFTFLADQILFHAFGISRDKQYRVPDNLIRMGWEVKLIVDVIIATNHFVFSSAYATVLTVQNTLLMGIASELNGILEQCDGILERVDQELKFAANGRDESMAWDILLKELNAVIARHSGLLEQIATLGSFLKMNFLVMFYMAIVIVGCASFYVNMLGLTVNTVIILSYVFAILTECYWFCRMTDSLNAANSEIGAKFFNLIWSHRVPENPNVRKRYRMVRATLLIVMSNTQRELGISCGGMFELSVQAFHELLKMIYSFLTFLLNTST